MFKNTAEQAVIVTSLYEQFVFKRIQYRKAGYEYYILDQTTVAIIKY